MTTFQALIYAFVHGITQFLPIGARAHDVLVPYITGWPQPTGALLGALTLGSLFALLIFFRHDWASMISSLLQVVIFRRRPMTMDERMPLFLAISTIPVFLVSSYFGEALSDWNGSPILITAIFAGIGVPLWFCDFVGRKSKGMADWNGLDAVWIGLAQSLAVLPGADFFTIALLCGLFLNYRREAAAKYAYFMLLPILLVQAMGLTRELNFSAPAPAPTLSWLSFGVALVVTTLTALLIMGGFMKNLDQKSLGQYVAYRWMLGALVCILFWIRLPSS